MSETSYNASFPGIKKQRAEWNSYFNLKKCES